MSPKDRTPTGTGTGSKSGSRGKASTGPERGSQARETAAPTRNRHEWTGDPDRPLLEIRDEPAARYDAERWDVPHFDTRKAIRILEGGGVPGEQADVHVEVLDGTLRTALAPLATKADLKTGLKDTEARLIAHTDKRHAEAMAHTDKKSAEAMAHTDKKSAEAMAHTDKKSAEAMAHTDKRHAEAMAHTDKRHAEAMAHTDKRHAEAIAHTDKKFAELQHSLAELRREMRWLMGGLGAIVVIALTAIGLIIALG